MPILDWLVRHRRRLIGGACAVGFMAWLLRLSILHWSEVKSGDDFFTFASLSTLAELMVVGLGSVFVRMTKSSVAAGVLVIASAIAFEGLALFQPMTGLAEALVPTSVIVGDDTRGANIDAALASGDADALQVAIGAVNPSLLTDSVADGALGPETRRAAAQAKIEIAQSASTAHVLWLAIPGTMTILALVVSLSLGHVAFGPEPRSKKERQAAQQPDQPAFQPNYSVEDFALGRMPSRSGFTRVGEAPNGTRPKGRGYYDPRGGSDTEESYAERARLMRVRLGWEKPALRVVN